MKNWKTSVIGAAVAAASYLWPAYQNIILPVGTFLLGLVSKDHNQTGN